MFKDEMVFQVFLQFVLITSQEHNQVVEGDSLMNVDLDQIELKFVGTFHLCNYGIIYVEDSIFFYFVRCCQFGLHRNSGVSQVIPIVHGYSTRWNILRWRSQALLVKVGSNYNSRQVVG